MHSVISVSGSLTYPEKDLPSCSSKARINGLRNHFPLPFYASRRPNSMSHWFGVVLGLLLWLSQFSSLYGQSLPDVPEEITFADVPVHLTQQARIQIQQEIQRLYAQPRVIQADISALRQLNPLLKPLFTKANLPDDFRFVALPFSDIDTLGFWGLSRPYATDLRLRMDSNVDERYHPILSAEAAVADLERLQTLKNNYVLALIRYLKGNTSQGVIEPTDPAYIMPGPQSPPLLWKILARKLVIQYEEPTYRPAVSYILYTYQYGEGQSLQNIANRLRVATERLKPFNQWLKTVVVPTDKKYTVLIRVTPDEFTTVQALAEPGLRNLRQLAIGFPILIKINKQEDGFRSEATFYEINERKGIQAQQCDNFITLAYYGGISIDKFLQYNDLNANQDVIHPGLIYYLERKAKRAKIPFHVAQKNQTLLEIANIYGVRLASLTKFNRMTTAQRLQRGRIVWLQTQRPLNQPVEYVQLPPEDPVLIPQPVITKPSVRDTVATRPEPKPVIPQMANKTADSVANPVDKPAPAVAVNKAVGKPAVYTDGAEKAKPPRKSMAADSLMQRDTIRIEVAEKRKWHIVKPGQTYYAIANLYGITLQQLYTWNNLSENIPLQVGQQLIVAYSRAKPTVTATMPKAQGRPVRPASPARPAGTSATRKAIQYTVRAGETLYRIALQNNVAVKDLIAWNNLRSNTIEIGQVLLIWK
jgi:membrane-bound lytic murein transglycosylase D